jgi:hypothetical protein
MQKLGMIDYEAILIERERDPRVREREAREASFVARILSLGQTELHTECMRRGIVTVLGADREALRSALFANLRAHGL